MRKYAAKYKKEIIGAISVLFVSAIMLLLIGGLYWRPLSNMAELGYQELTPVSKTFKSIEVNDGYESTQYSVIVEVNTPSGSRWAYIEIEEAYGEEYVKDKYPNEVDKSTRFD